MIVINMVGWGIDIKLGFGVREFGGLVVIGIEWYEFCCIDN